ncbi:MAG: primosomal protein N' [Firmicutes bacterium]|nr:primosomal protein N' [Bacillota bacterium]
MIARVIVDISNNEVDKIFDYLSIDGAKPGHRVMVPFGRRQIEGYVISLSEKSDYDNSKLKKINRLLDENPVITSEMLELMEFMKYRYHLRIVDILRLFIPAQMRGGRIKELTRLFASITDEFKAKNIEEFIKPNSLAQRELFEFLLENNGAFVSLLRENFSSAAYNNLLERGVLIQENRKVNRTPYKSIGEMDNEFVLTAAQENAVQTIVGANKNRKFLLHGVTGSGKTEVYLRCIDNILKQNKTAILLVPEISLTPQVFSKFKSRFCDKVAILHSGLSAGERFDEWQRLLNGEAVVAIGARSAIFAPLRNLGLIIIDEEHDGSYSSESNPRYRTQEIAEFRAKHNDCALILGSATPSVETYYQTKVGEYNLIEMPHRINNTLPKVQIVNMCTELYQGNNSLFSKDLHNALKDCLDKNNQAMLFINRRGYSSFVRCTSCGYVAMCERCDVSLVLHKEEGNQLKCHYCQNRYNVPVACPICQHSDFRRGYLGTQQVEEKIRQIFPAARTLRMDNDTTQNKDAHLNILSQFREKKADILIGTQMIAKGHDFPEVTVVGIIDADISLHFSDYKANERTFQLITQVSGRAGRADKAGNVYLQTYSPNHFVYKFACEVDYHAFYKKEINIREVTSFPPFANILRILVSGEHPDKIAQILKAIYEKILTISKEKKDCFSYLGYMHSPVKKIKGQIRMQILMRVKNSFDEILQLVYNIVDEHKKKDIAIFVEINPNSLS